MLFDTKSTKKEIKKIVKLRPPEYADADTSDGYHTFKELYNHRYILFSVICNTNKSISWKSKKHYTGDMYEGMFIAGITTPEGNVTYHCEIDPYWDLFDVVELDNAPEWDGYTPDEGLERIKSINNMNIIEKIKMDIMEKVQISNFSAINNYVLLDDIIDILNRR